jgi:hypothetical protein
MEYYNENALNGDVQEINNIAKDLKDTLTDIHLVSKRVLTAKESHDKVVDAIKIARESLSHLMEIAKGRREDPNEL